MAMESPQVAKGTSPYQLVLQFLMASWFCKSIQATANNAQTIMMNNTAITKHLCMDCFVAFATRNNVVILVESWGIPLDINRFNSQLDIFGKSITKAGVHNRMYSRTRTAEREDLMQTLSRNSTGRKDTIFLPKIFANIGYKTTFLCSQDSLIQRRYKYITNIGFSEAFYENNQNDSTIARKIDSILADTTQKHFIAWTTGDTRFPLPGFSNIYNSDASTIDSAYTKLLMRTLETIAALAHKHPETRFIVQGDHNPILSPIKFQERFYKRWVPFVVLN